MAFDYLRQTLFFFRRHVLTLATIQLPFLVVLALVQHKLLDGLTPQDSEFQLNAALSSILDITLLPFYWGATIFYLQSVVDNAPLSIGGALSRSFTCWGRLLLTYVLNAIAVSLGLMMLIVPGVYFGIRFSFADYVCVLEGKRPVDSMRHSWDSSKPYFWVLLQGIALLMGVLLLANVGASRLFSDQPLLADAASVILDFLGVLITIYGFRIYCVMREERG